MVELVGPTGAFLVLSLVCAAAYAACRRWTDPSRAGLWVRKLLTGAAFVTGFIAALSALLETA